MAIQLGNVLLNDDLRLYGIEEAPDILVAEYESFDGTVDFLLMPASGQRMLSLVATLEDDRLTGSFTLSQITAIKSIITAGQPTKLVHPRGTFSVMVLRVESFQKAWDLVEVSDDDWCVATIIMREV